MKEVWCKALLQAPNMILLTYKKCSLFGPSFFSDESDPSLWNEKFLGGGDWLMRKAGLVCEIISCTQ